MGWKVGQVCRRTGLTVRTLHHYESIGLLRPSGRTQAGHRLYSAEDLARLLQIVALRQLGMSLGEVASCLAEPSESLLVTIERRLAAVDSAIAEQGRLRERLVGLAAHLRRHESPSLEEVVDTVEHMTMIEKYFTQEQLDALAVRRAELGEEGMEAGQRAWQEVYDQARAAKERGASPHDPEVVALRERAQTLVQSFTGGDPAMQASLGRLWQEEKPALHARFGFDPAVFAFLWGRG